MARVIRKPGNVSWQELRIGLKDLGNTVGKVGWFESARYEDGTPVAYVATIQEYGSQSNNIPPRPFMRPTIAQQRNAWNKIIEDGSRQVLKGKITMFDVMNALGLVAVADIKKTIAGIQSPPLKEGTIADRQRRHAVGKSRGTAKPLIDTGHMFDTVTYTVETKK